MEGGREGRKEGKKEGRKEYFNNSSEGDAIRTLACWNCIPMIRKTYCGWHPRAETCRRLILVMNCMSLSSFVG
jgi:hypothetical protein